MISPEGHERSPAAQHRSRLPGWILLLGVLVAAASLHSPSLRLGFVGDDFQWWQAARMALDDPVRLILPFGGLRPANMWILAAEHVVFGTDPRGYHATSIFLHLACGVVLWLVLVRLAMPLTLRTAVVLLWLCSPYTLEPAQSVCERFEPLLLLSWCGMALVWPGPHQPFARPRLAVVGGLAALSALSKESWVVLPGFFIAFELLLRRQALGPTIRRATLVAVMPLVYVMAYMAAPPIPLAYYGSVLVGALKVPHSWAVFSSLTSLRPLDFNLGVAEILALLMMVGLGWLAWRRRSIVAGLGFALFLLPWLPILPVAFLSSRYTAIPLAGFLLVMADAIQGLLAVLSGWRRRAAVAGAAVLFGLYFVAGLMWFEADMDDARARDALHRQLVAEARAAVELIPADHVIVAVRIESDNQNLELSSSGRGEVKVYFPRHHDPYGLIDWAALLSYVMDAHGGPLYEAVAPAAVSGRPFVELLHLSGRFELLPPQASDLSTSVARWRERQHHVRVLRPWSPADGQSARRPRRSSPSESPPPGS